MRKKTIILLFLSSIFLVGFASLLLPLNEKDLPEKKAEMMNLTTGKSYENDWKRVDSLDQKGLPEDALKLVNAIYDKATTEDNQVQVIKALIYQMKYTQWKEEDAILKNVERLKAQLKTAKFPAKPLLHSILGQVYWNYYQQNQWQYAQRTATDGLDEDLRTWDLRKIVDAAMRHYSASIGNPEQLRKVKIDFFDPILVKHDFSEIYRPSLLDFLGHRAFDVLQNDVHGLAKPAYQFNLEGSEIFGDDKSFVQHSYQSQDKKSFTFQALLLIQEMTRQHLNDDNPEALTFLNIERLKFAKNKSSLENKEKLYLSGLQSLYKKVSNHSVCTWVAWEIGTVFLLEGSKYNASTSDEYKTARKKAWQVMSAAVDLFPDSKGAINCKYQINELERKELSFQCEKVNQDGKPFRGLLNYRNLDKVYFKVVRVSPDITTSWRGMNLQQRAEILNKLYTVKEWSQDLPKDPDLNLHKVEVETPSLEAGAFAILIGSDSSFSSESQGLVIAFTHVSSFTYTSMNIGKGQKKFVVVDYASGKPVAGVKATMQVQKYNYDLRKYFYKTSLAFKTDKKGAFVVPAMAMGSESYHMVFEHEGRSLRTDDNWYRSQYYQNEELPSKRTILYLDRGIYRPGQTVYFKGLVLETYKGKSKVLTNFATQVDYMDANYEKVSSLKVRTNDYGTFSGSFTIPQGGLNGQMYLQESNGSVYFRVEDYKRPKFEVTFDPIKESFRLEDEVRVKGRAMAYAGSNIDGAKVSYRVERTASFPWWGCWGYWRQPQPYASGMEIAHGEVNTDENGEFEIKFKALADKSLNPELKAQFAYSVTATVTDITGETHDQNINVNVGYIGLNASIAIPDKIDLSGKHKFKIATSNLNGEFEAAQGKITITKLISPKQNYRNRYWEQADKFLLTEPEYHKRFPHDLYKDENNEKLWGKGKVAYEKNFDTEKNDSLDLGSLSKWEQGRYIVELVSADKWGTEVRNQTSFTLKSLKSEQLPLPTFISFEAEKMTFEPGENAEFSIGTTEDELWVYWEIIHKDKTVQSEWFQLKGNKKRFSIPVEEKHRGNWGVYFMAVKNGRIYHDSRTFIVPWSNKVLNIEYETFRDKLLPGSEEEWKLKISGPNGEEVDAEIMAGMYDASLDAFAANYWGLNTNSTFSVYRWPDQNAFAAQVAGVFSQNWNPSQNNWYQAFDQLNWFGLRMMGGRQIQRYYSRNRNGVSDSDMMLMDIAEEEPADMPVTGGVPAAFGNANMPTPKRVAKEEVGTRTGEGKDGGKGRDLADVQVRTNLNETAFFFPQLQTNAKGETILKFTMPEALTRWKFMTLAHTKDLKTGYKEATVVTQKDLMVMPNPPRFFREGDEIVFTAKVSNLSDRDLEGQASLELFDALTMQPLDLQLGNAEPNITFQAKKGQSALLSWRLEIPSGIQAVLHRVKAKAGKFTDGEESALPVLSNRMLVTEAMPLPIRPKQKRSFRFDHLIDHQSKTLSNHKLTLEFTSNPAWYAIQALPYLMEYPYECTEQTFSRYYANSLASHIANSHPRIKRVFEAWKTQGKEALLSNLEKNQELKYLLLEETPWVLQARSESERKKRVGLLFDLNKMEQEMAVAKRKIVQAQVSNGGFPWFPGMRESRYITQHVVAGMGHLKRLGLDDIQKDADLRKIIEKAVNYLDQRIREDFEKLIARPKVDLTLNHLSNIQIHYLYARSFFTDIKIPKGTKKAFDYYRAQEVKYWLDYSRYQQGLMALGLHRYGNQSAPKDILKSIKQHSLQDNEMGMYWKVKGYGIHWYEAPIETQALMIEAFDEVLNDQKSVEEMKIWLLKQKQTTDWKTTKATVEACYALLLRGTDILAESELADITVGGKRLDPKADPSVKIEAGTGYFKTSWMGSDIKSEMGNVEVENKNEVVAWGAMYWQYFEQLDKIEFAENDLKMKKQLFLQENTATGPKLSLLDADSKLEPGDLVKVRILLETDRNLEYVHMKDMRAAGFEPVNVNSVYKYQDGLGYYESTRDAATNFFFDWLPKGKYVFEYPLRVTHKGDFSNGITTLQCMYAPEFTAHSEGIRVKID